MRFFTELLAFLIIIFLCWNSKGDPQDNWDKLDIIIHAKYYEIMEED